VGRGLGVGGGRVAAGVGVAVAVAVAVGVGVGLPWQLGSQFPALTITLPQSPLCIATVPT
jgi:hypothetical protein